MARGGGLRTGWALALMTLALWAMAALALTSLADEAPTFDEQGFLVRGLAYLRGEARAGNRTIRVGHPLGLNALNAALLVNDGGVRLPDDPSLHERSFHRPAELFLWQSGNDVGRTMFLARVPTIWLGLLLAAAGGRWAGQMAAGWGLDRRAANLAALVALWLLAFDPNILAHTRLTTTDLGLAAAAALAGYTLWRWLRQPTPARVLVAGAALGVLQNTKFTALLFVPLFGLVVLLAIWRWRGAGRRALVGRLAHIAVVYPVVGLLTLWALYGFQVGPLSAPLPLMGAVDGAAVPLSHHLDQLLDIGGRLQVGTPAFLLGQYSDSGWWYYFPVAFLLKTPLPVLLLTAFSLFRIASWAWHQRPSALRRRAGAQRPRAVLPPGMAHPAAPFDPLDLAALLIPALGYFAIALTTDINLGYRHLLPILPFLYVLSGAVVAEAVSSQWPVGGVRSSVVRRLPAVALILAWLTFATLWIHPHFVAYFNVLAGGPENGWRALVDSNIDWGQDLERLADWLEDNGVERVWLSYFGEGRPEYYGITYDGLDSFPPRLMNPNARPFYPHDPAPGWYAISATTLQGVHLADHDLFRYFRERPPADKVGYSIFLYEQPARGKPVDLLLSRLPLDAIVPNDYSALGTNDARPRWFDGTGAIILPNGERPVWLATDGSPLNPMLQPYLAIDDASAISGDGYRLAQATPHPPAGEGRPLSLDGHEMTFLGAPHLDIGPETVELVLAWRQESEPRPVKLFVHVLDEAGGIVTQWDGLDAAWEGWRPGDTLLQSVTLALPAGTPAGAYRLTAGLYDPETSQRWGFADGSDAVELARFATP